MSDVLNMIFSQSIEVYILWTFRLGALIWFISILIPEKDGNIILKKKLHEIRMQLSGKERSKIMIYLDKMTEKKYIRPFMMQEDSEKYAESEELIVKAGITNGLTPNIVRLFKIALPIIIFIIFSISYFIIFSNNQQVAEKAQQISSVLPQNFLAKGFFQSNVTVEKSDTSFITNIFKMWIVIISIISFTMPDAYIKLKIGQRENAIHKELPSLEMYISIMLETEACNVYEILETLSTTTDFFKPYLEKCLKEYSLNSKRAIQNMADAVKNDEFQIVCNALKQGVEVEKGMTASFLKQHLNNLNELQNTHREEKIKLKPLYHTLVLMLPLYNVLILWLSPWLVRALNAINSDF